MSDIHVSPSIRFTSFSENWEQHKFSDLVTIERGGSPRPIDDYITDAPNGLNWVKIGDAPSQGRYITRTAEKIKPEGLSKTRQVHPGDLILSNSMSFGRPYIMGIDGCIHDGWLLIRDTQGHFDLKFLCHLLGTNQMLDQYRMLAAGSTVSNLNKELVGNTTVAIPSIAEQKAIGECLEALDSHITQHQRQHDRLLQTKKAMLLKMFPRPDKNVPEIRFAGFDSPWKQRKLGELVQFSKGSGYSKSDLQKAGTPIILYGRLYTQYETVITAVDTFADEKPGSVYSRGGEVIVPASGETAEDISIASVVEQAGVLLGGDLNIITPPDDIDSAFLAISISNGKPHADMAKMAQGKSVVHLHNADLEKIDLVYPDYDEQTLISAFFRRLDDTIVLHKNRLTILVNLKKAMLQKMFPMVGRK